ncbi:MAG: DJ-1/PfpI family protein [Planctomycetes bacterium]|nr:DJ-1/PfpI family protein [Planctomycetota bacterium]MBI3844796.1 DJ-1/PfpI family protein [Planctomycetota bacterium]
MAGKLAGKKVLMVVAPDQFRDEELLEPKRILETAGATVKVASTKASAAKGMLGATVKPDLVLSAARPDEYDAVVVVGGMGSPKYLWGDASLHDVLRKTFAAGRVIGGICLSGAALARAGVLREKEATVYKTPDSLAELSEGGARFVDKPVIVSGNVITANGPQAATAFGNALVQAIALTTTATKAS